VTRDEKKKRGIFKNAIVPYGYRHCPKKYVLSQRNEEEKDCVVLTHSFILLYFGQIIPFFL
jgi:hypothetical protein